MKKHLLLTAIASGLMFGAYAQSAQRLVLYEEFTGENCPPCATTNPGLEALMETGTNPENVVMIKYQVNIPSAGPIYGENTTIPNNRRSYYGVTSAPNGKMDGANSPGGDGGGHPAYLTQTHIDTRSAVGSPFTITLSDISISTSGVSATINITATESATYGNLKLRAALIETLDFETPPGTNGESFFPNVVRGMYPDPNGQSIENTWSSGSSNTYTISGSFPSYSSINNEHYIVVWIQDDDGKVVHQAARNYADLEISSEKMTISGGLLCGTPNTFTPQVTFKNIGATTVTSATIYYRERGAASWESYSWTGSLSKNETATVTLPDVVSTNTGLVVFEDSVAMPNGVADQFSGNNTSRAGTYVLANSGGVFPISTGFESTTPEFVEYAPAGGYPIFRWNGAGRGYDGSNYMLVFPCYGINSGVQGFSVFPFAALPAGEKALDFYVAYCQYEYENDKLEVVYSTNCGASWTSVWSKSGAALASKAAQKAEFIPDGNSQWKFWSVDVSSIPDGAQIAFKATSGYGNHMFIDNVNLRAGAVETGINEVFNTSTFEVYPNPANNLLNLSMDAHQSFEADIILTNISGQTVLQLTKEVKAGNNEFNIDVSALAPGTYMISVGDKEHGASIKKFVKQ